MTQQLDPVRVIVEDLLDKGCCKRCVLRYVGSSPESFEDPESALIVIGVLPPELEDELHAQKRRKMNACIVCLGLLSEPLFEEILSHRGIEGMLKITTEDYTLNVTYATSLLLREQSMLIYLRETYKDNFDKMSVVPMQRAWRYAIEKKMTKLVGKPFCHTSRVRLHVVTDYDLDVDEAFVVTRLNRKLKLGKDFGRHSIVSTLENSSDDHFKKYVRVPPRISLGEVELKDVNCYGQDFTVAGTYCKFSRNINLISQHEKNALLLDHSISSMIVDAFKQILGDKPLYDFRTSGYENQHDRVLNQGRTFCIAITNPIFGNITDVQMDAIQNLINRSKLIKVQNLREVNRVPLRHIMDREALLPKSYRALCTIEGPKEIGDYVKQINSFSSFKVKQKTPIRVCSIKNVVTTEKIIYKIKARAEEGKKSLKNLIVLDVLAQAGLYISEFIHGDFRRTKPSLGTLCNAKADILALDIMELVNDSLVLDEFEKSDFNV